jgi:hypothetical protein
VIPYSVSIPITFGIAIPCLGLPTLTAAGRVRGHSGDAADREEVRGTLVTAPHPAAYRYWPVVVMRSTGRFLSLLSPVSGLT